MGHLAQVRASGRTDAGKIRTKNQDALAVCEDVGLFAVSDGMGGQAAGHVAARTAVGVLQREMRAAAHLVQVAARTFGAIEPVRDALVHAFQTACQEVWELGRTRPDATGVSATLTAVVVAGSRAVLAHVGNSRLYMLRSGVLHRMTGDHTVAAELAAAGAITPDRIASHPYRNALTRSVGRQAAVEADVLMFDVLPGDRLLLCTDGLVRYVEEGDWLAEELGQSDIETLPERLVARANDAGGRDNVTCVAVEIGVSQNGTRQAHTTASRVRALEGTDAFGGLTLDQAARILSSSTTADVSAGQTLVHAGEELEAFYVVIQGRLEIRSAGRVLRELGEGDYTGTVALLARQRARASLVAVEDSRVLVLERQAFRDLVRNRPALGIHLLELIGERLGRALDAALEGSEVAEL